MLDVARAACFEVSDDGPASLLTLKVAVTFFGVRRFYNGVLTMAFFLDCGGCRRRFV